MLPDAIIRGYVQSVLRLMKEKNLPLLDTAFVDYAQWVAVAANYNVCFVTWETINAGESEMNQSDRVFF